MTDSLVERVARAISAACSVSLHGGKTEDYSADDWQDFEDDAQAAISATPLQQLEDALREIAEYKWPVIVGHHKQVFHGEATGREYSLNHPIPKEQPLTAIKSMKEIARTALQGSLEKGDDGRA